ncbi:regulation of nuclear pre-mRNA domain-containing protein 2-like isoform X2 [Mya arenaria]|uniref:regulation of nuclear pre-mRNA domain-containing protein 2-like isoform X2 n=1 Tax=Mya arenaria TaxID=6604 RepID=UPI0022E7EE33|nr:regulation of nuclear pre-mRNA domain-containing protein 2-like isoform X2 [Mya arenaria]
MADAKKGKKLSGELIEKKMMSFNSTQESVQAMSLWIMHNKAHHQKIVDTWLKVLKKCEVKHKLTLFYLCNDVVQHAKKKKALYYLENFKVNLRDAVQAIREYDSIKPNVGRVFKIWEDRKTYDQKFVSELRGILDGGNSSKSSSARSTPAQASPAYRPSSKAHRVEEVDKPIPTDSPVAVPTEEPVIEDHTVSMADFKPPALLEEMTHLRKMEIDVTSKAKQLASLRIDATNIEAIKQLKDRSHGNEFCRQFEESCVKIEDYVSLLEKEIKHRKKVLGFCEGAEDFYSEQFREANIVATAYKNFGARVTNMKNRVDDMKKIIPASPSPMPSPTVDAPSPGNTPPQEGLDLNIDDNETVDMDLCDDTDQARTVPNDVPVTQGVPPPTQTFQGSNILESRIAHMLPNLARGSSGMVPDTPPPMKDFSQPPLAPFPMGVNPAQPSQPETYKHSRQNVYTPTQLTIPEPIEADDAGSSTPVMDEPEEKSPPRPEKPSDGKTKANPIDFLSQLLTKTSNASSSSSSNFLQTLSLLTNTVKNQYQSKKEAHRDTHGEGRIEERPPEPKSPPPSEPPMMEEQNTPWSGWKPGHTQQPPLPQQDPSSPPIMMQMKTQAPPLPVQQPPVPPPQPQLLPPRQFPPPSQDFSMPPPGLRPGSQPFVSPPPIPSMANPFPPMSSAVPFSSAIISSAPPSVYSTESVTSPITATTTLVSKELSQGFNPVFPFRNAPPRPDVTTVQHRPPLPGGLPVQPHQRFPPPPPGGNSWEPPPGGPPNPPLPNLGHPLPPSFPGNFVNPPPPPPSTSAAVTPSWQQEPLPPPGGPAYNPISAGQRPSWGQNQGQDFQQPHNWVPANTNENQDSRYQHPWDQPQDFDDEEEEEEENEYEEPPPATSHTMAPKSILRNSRASSLKEVTLIDENSRHASKGAEMKPAGILKKPPTGINPASTRNTDTQNEFINILKQKSSSSANLPPPPLTRTLTSINTVETGASACEAISTIGVIGNSGRPTSAGSDDMDIDNDNGYDPEQGFGEIASETWEQSENPGWNRPVPEPDSVQWEEKQEPEGQWGNEQEADSGDKWGNNDQEYEGNDWHESPQDRPHGDYHRDNFNRGPQWQDNNGQRPWHPRPRLEQDSFRPRNFTPRPQFQDFGRPRDNFRGSSDFRGKRPFFSPRQRRPYNRY